MGIFDKIKEAVGSADQLNAKADQVVDQVADFIDDKTGGKFSDKIDAVQNKAKELDDKIVGLISKPGEGEDAVAEKAAEAASAADAPVDAPENPDLGAVAEPAREEVLEFDAEGGAPKPGSEELPSDVPLN